MTTRRRFLQLAGGLALATPLARAAELLPTTAMRAVVVGGGFGGAIAAKTLRMAYPELDVVLVERSRGYTALPGSNWIIGGSRRIGENQITYDRLESGYGVKMLYQEARGIDIAEKRVVFAAGTLAYDFLIVAPGIGFRFGDIEGYVPDETPTRFPHAWASGEEVLALKRRLEEMKNGGVVAVSLPAPPYRCPQAAYERVSQIACYLKQAKARSKIIVLDAGAQIGALPELFVAGWQRDYGSLIEYRGGQQVQKIDAAKARLSTANDSITADVVNLIPPQRAGELAHQAGLVGEDKRWCPVDHTTHESALASGVYVIGDACLAEGVQKSAAAANAQGKACAMNIVATLAKRKPQQHLYANVVYSLLNDREGASTVSFHRGEGRKLTAPEKGGGASAAWSELEAVYARAWLGSMLAEMSS